MFPMSKGLANRFVDSMEAPANAPQEFQGGLEESLVNAQDTGAGKPIAQPVQYASNAGATAQQPTSASQQNSPTSQNRELGPFKWQANPYPDWIRKAHGKAGPILGAGVGGLIGFEVGGPPGAVGGAALGGLVGAYSDDFIDYIGIPSNVEVNLPEAYTPDIFPAL